MKIMFGVRNDNSKQCEPSNGHVKKTGLRKWKTQFMALRVPLFQIVAPFTFADFPSFRGGSLRPSCRYNSNGLFDRVRNKLRTETTNMQKVIQFRLLL